MCIEKEGELGMSERQMRVTTEVFVGGLDREVKEEDVRAGETIEVRMVKDASVGDMPKNPSSQYG